MLKGIIINGEVRIVEIEENDNDNRVEYRDCELCNFDELLDYCCEVGDVVEEKWILIKDEIIKIENEDIIRVGIGK